MNEIRYSLLASVVFLCGCGTSPPDAHPNGDEFMVVTEITVSGFDPDGEPTIRTMSDGSLHIHFEAMPPFFAEDAGIESEFDDFRVEIEFVTGCAVLQDDRELFIIHTPRDNTAVTVRNWLESYRKPNGG